MPPVVTKLKSKTLHSQAREIVSNVHEFMKREAELGIQMALKKFGKRTQAATGVSERTVRNIVSERRDKESSEHPSSFSTPGKTRSKASPN